MKAKNKKTVFLIQISDNNLIIINTNSKNGKPEFNSLAVSAIPQGIDNNKLSGVILQALKSLGYRHNPIIFSVRRDNVTLRHIKIPSNQPEEIEKMASLQASKFLPYPANELITGYQIIKTDSDGFTHLNLVIAHRNIIQKYTAITRVLEPIRFSITLGSYGIVNLYNYLKPQDLEPVMIIDIDLNAQIAELVILSKKNLLFSRCFTLKTAAADSEQAELFTKEINRTIDVYLKEVTMDRPARIVIIGLPVSLAKFRNFIGDNLNLPVEFVPLDNRINLSEKFKNHIETSGYSLSDLIGLGLETLEESLNLLSQDVKSENKKAVRYNSYTRITLLLSAAALMLIVATAKNLNTKQTYSEDLKTQLTSLLNEAKPLEEIDKRISELKIRAEKQQSSLDIFATISQSIPEKTLLTSIVYDKDNQIIIRGETDSFNSVFDFVSHLEKSAALKGFNVKARYMTKKEIKTIEIINFEIICLKQK